MTGPNAERAAWALDAVIAFRRHGGSLLPDDTPDYAESIGDLIADLMHLCDQHDIDPFERIKNGVGHYVAETLDPEQMSHEVKVDVAVHVKRYGEESSFIRSAWKLFFPAIPA